MTRRALAALTLAWSACSISAGLPRASFTATRGTAPPSRPSDPEPARGATTSSRAQDRDDSDPTARVLVVPDVIGKTADEARALVRAAGFAREVELSTMLSCDGPRRADRITCQSPAAGTRVTRNDWVQIAVHTVQPHKTWSIEPDQLRPLIGRPLAEVKQRLRGLGHVGHLDVREDAATSATCHDDLVCDLDQGGTVRLDSSIHVSLAIPPDAQ